MAEYREFQDGELIAGTRYRVVKLIGVGGMGTVYEVEHTELGKRFVLKALLRELSRRQDLVIRLRNEWRALGRLEHPNIVTVTDAGTSGTGVPFYVMERLEGETLAQRMRRTRRFPVREAVEIAVGILEGLAAAHQISVVHRDVKPPNIFLLSDGRPKVLDFGVAKIADDPGVVTARGVAVGTPRYMSPEQARGESVDGRADVYSTGLILFEIITGVSPYEDAKDANELILAHLARKAPRLSSLAMGVPPALDHAIAAMLAKAREERPASALEASKLLRDVLAAGLVPPATETKRASTPPRRESVPAPARPSAPPDTTRPDGVALRAVSTATSVSAAGLSWLERPTLPGSPLESSSADTAWGPSSRDNRASADTLIGLPPTEFPESLSPQITDAGPRVHTEILTAIPLPEPEVTRTMAPERHPSETPPPVSPMPSAAPFAPPQTKARRALWAWSIPVVLGLAVAAIATRTPTPAPSAPRAAVQSEPPVPVPARPALAPVAAQTAVAQKAAEAHPTPSPVAAAPNQGASAASAPAPAATEKARISSKSKTSSARSADPATSSSHPARSNAKPRASAAETPEKAVQAALPSSGL